MSSGTVVTYPIIVATVDLTLLELVNTLDVCPPCKEGAVEPLFHYVFVDEAGSVDLPRMSLILPLAVRGQTLLVGDTDQLPAYITSQKVKNVAGDESATEFLDNIILRSGRGFALRLENNYRSLLEIIEPSNQEICVAPPLKAINHKKLERDFFQDDTISNGNLTNALFQGTIVTSKGFGVAFRHVEDNQVKLGTSWFNPEELCAVVTLVEYMIHECFIHEADIDIDSTYAAQGVYLKQLFAVTQPFELGAQTPVREMSGRI